jgi:tetratricopeptide (TPR) repeat protein
MLEGEIDDLQRQILQFAGQYFGDELQEDFLDYEEHLMIAEEQERQFYELMHAIWFILFEPLEDGETILEKFIETESANIKRPKLREILQTWTDARTIAGKVLEIENNKLIVEDGLTSEVLVAFVVNKSIEIEEGCFFVGVIVPYEQNYLFYPTAFDLPQLQPEHASEFIIDSSLEYGYDSPTDYYTDFFIQILHDLPMLGGESTIDTIEWSAPIYKEVAELFQEELNSQGESELVVQTGVLLWSMFCEKRQKRIKNPMVYVAALHYLLSTIAPVVKEYTQKEVAELYQVSVGTVSSIYREIEIVLEHELTELMEMIYGDGKIPSVDNMAPMVQFKAGHNGSPETERILQETMAELQEQNFESIDEINEFMNKRLNSPLPKKTVMTTKERAQQKIYDAYEVEGLQRYKLAKEALKLDPNCVDAYVLLAEYEGSLKKAAEMYEKGMKVGEKELGAAFFKENKGHFWGLIETRPYIRAKVNYAEALYQLGKVDQAIKQYEEILELNAMDNQGVRYSLFPAYLEQMEIKKAEKLLEQFEEGGAYCLYNKLLLELLKNGFTPKSAKLLKEAKKENRHVIALLTGKKRIPKQLPDYYGMGDENEAIIYADAHLPLWKKIEGLKDWLETRG